MPIIDITNKKFGRLVVLKRAENRGNYKIYWGCKCECGNTKEIYGEHLKRGLIKSCGCLMEESRHTNNLKHGATKDRKWTKEYISWSHAKSRCFNIKNKKYNSYGGRGIIMCEKWKDNFPAFLNDMGKCPEKHSIDRINNNGNYEPLNCKWSTNTEQAKNKRNIVWLEYNGNKFTMKDLSKILGIDYKIFHYHIRRKKQTVYETIEEINNAKI